MRGVVVRISIIELVENSYSGMGSREKGLPQKFFNFINPYWQNGVISPLFLKEDEDLEAKDLKKIEKYFKNASGLKFNDKKQAHYNILIGSGVRKPSSQEKVLLESGWTKSADTVLNYWLKPIQLKLPEGYYFASASTQPSKLRNDFFELTSVGFKTDKIFEQRLINSWANILDSTRLVVLYHPDGTPVGSGAVTTKNNCSFLWVGTINPKFQGKGLWYGLVAARQLVSKEMGSEFWLTSTNNPRIIGRGDKSLSYDIYVKDL